jgi:tRNA(fMet)-specific endonuclease VapC
VIRFLLDTDHVSLQERGYPLLRTRLASLPPDSFAVSVITVEEMIRGRLAILARRSEGEARVHAYTKFMEAVAFFNSIPVLTFDEACEQKFQEIRSLRIRIGSQDIRIAATALVYNLILLTRNRQDFTRIPDLSIEDWSLPK